MGRVAVAFTHMCGYAALATWSGYQARAALAVFESIATQRLAECGGYMVRERVGEVFCGACQQIGAAAT